MATNSKLCGKLEAELKIKQSPDKFFNALAKTAHALPDGLELIHDIDLHESNWDEHGAIKCWSYTNMEGEKETFLERQEINEKNRTVTFNGIGGTVMNDFKVIRTIYVCLRGVVRIIANYELRTLKSNTSPETYLPFLIKLVKDIDAHIADW